MTAGGGAAGVEDPTARLGTFLAFGYGVQLAAGLLGVGIGNAGPRFVLLHPLLIGLAVLLVRRVRAARTLLLVLTWVQLMLFAIATLLGFAQGRYLGMVVAGAQAALSAGQMVALALTIPEAHAAGGVPDDWRPWGTSVGLHLTILVALVLAAFTSG